MFEMPIACQVLLLRLDVNLAIWQEERIIQDFLQVYDIGRDVKFFWNIVTMLHQFVVDEYQR